MRARVLAHVFLVFTGVSHRSGRTEPRRVLIHLLLGLGTSAYSFDHVHRFAAEVGGLLLDVLWVGDWQQEQNGLNDWPPVVEDCSNDGDEAEVSKGQQREEHSACVALVTSRCEVNSSDAHVAWDFTVAGCNLVVAVLTALLVLSFDLLGSLLLVAEVRGKFDALAVHALISDVVDVALIVHV